MQGTRCSRTQGFEVLSVMAAWFASGIYYGAQNDYKHIFIIWELISQMHRTSVTQGLLAE